MKVTILGCGGSAGSPQIGGADGGGDWGQLDPAEPRNRRTRPSIVMENGAGERLLVDTGPDLRMQLNACGLGRIDSVIYTHAHADHIAGLDEIRILNRILGRPMPCYATPVCRAELEQRFDYAFKPWDSAKGYFRPVLEMHDVAAGQVVEILGLPVRLIDQDHGFIRSLGLRMGGFAYSTDVVRLDEAALAALQGLDVWVVDCFTSGPPHPTHANLATVLGWVARLKPKRTILTHMGPDMDFQHLLATLPAGVEPGFDGMVVSLGASLEPAG